MMTRLRPHWFPELWTQLPLPRLFDDDDVDGAGRWSFAIVTIERSGRVTLPAVARSAFEGRVSLRLSSRGEVALLRCGGGGRPVAVGARGRFVVPCWLRDAADPERSLLVGTGTDHDGEPVVLFAPLRLLWGFADAMVGERW
jgi:bifunctional DNA-binding transcriptional regulator/antitoxin component of YhaV-PrlF toxin-antitoxin module